MKNFKDKVVVISGAGSGIGKALALNFAKEGAKLAISDINPGRLDETTREASKHGVHVHAQIHDVVNWEDYQSYADQVIEHYGHVDIVINNAGVALGSSTIEEVTIEEFKWLMDINFWGMVYGTKAFLPHLRKRSESSITNISSILGLAAISKQGPYCSSKFAIRGFTESLRMEAMLDFPHVHVLSVHPGGIQTNIARDARWQEGSMSEEERDALATEFEKSFINTPDYAANDIMNAIRKKKLRLLIGSDARRLWRFVHWFPVGYTKLLYKHFLKNIEEAANKIQNKSN